MQRGETAGEVGVGILLFATAGQRIRGDAGYPGTFPFPVRYGMVEGSYRDLVEGSPAACERVVAAARRLELAGVRAVAGDCGLMALYQREIASAVQVPVISSSLVLLPLIAATLARDAVVGVITGHSALLGAHHLRAAGAGVLRCAVQGMQGEPHFCEVVIEGAAPQDYSLMRRDLLSAAGKLLAREPAAGALLLECSNLATFSRDLYKKYKLPVFDINLAARMLHASVSPADYR